MKLTLAALLKVFQDSPWEDIGEAAASGGTNIPLDVKAAKGIFSAIVEDIFNPETDTTTATPATAATQAPAATAAIADNVAKAS